MYFGVRFQKTSRIREGKAYLFLAVLQYNLVPINWIADHEFTNYGVGLRITCNCKKMKHATSNWCLRRTALRYEGISKFPDWIYNEINNNKHSLRSNTKGYGGKTHYTDSQNSDTTAPSGRELYHL
jgi:hypothetical protein